MIETVIVNQKEQGRIRVLVEVDGGRMTVAHQRLAVEAISDECGTLHELICIVVG